MALLSHEQTIALMFMKEDRNIDVVIEHLHMCQLQKGAGDRENTPSFQCLTQIP